MLSNTIEQDCTVWICKRITWKSTKRSTDLWDTTQKRECYLCVVQGSGWPPGV